MHDKFEKERPYEIVSTITNEALDVPRNNYEGWDEREVPITDVRGDESLYQLDTHGFTYRPMRHDFSDFYDKHKVETEFIPKVVEPFLKANVEGWDKIHLFDWRVCWSIHHRMISGSSVLTVTLQLRRNDPAKVPPLQYFKDGTKPWLPAKKAHVGMNHISIPMAFDSSLSLINQTRDHLVSSVEYATISKTRPTSS